MLTEILKATAHLQKEEVAPLLYKPILLTISKIQDGVEGTTKPCTVLFWGARTMLSLLEKRNSAESFMQCPQKTVGSFQQGVCICHYKVIYANATNIDGILQAQSDCIAGGLHPRADMMKSEISVRIPRRQF